MSLRERTRLGLGIIEPCLPSPAKVPPSGPGWLHEIKHDGFRILARKDAAGVRLIARAGNDFSSRITRRTVRLFFGRRVGSDARVISPPIVIALNTLKTCGASTTVCGQEEAGGRSPASPKHFTITCLPLPPRDVASRCSWPHSRSIADAPTDLNVFAKAIGPMGDHNPAVLGLVVVLVVVVVPVRTNVNAVRANADVQSVCRNTVPAVSVTSAANASIQRFIGTSSRRLTDSSRKTVRGGDSFR
jgi:hypothetical protein